SRRMETSSALRASMTPSRRTWATGFSPRRSRPTSRVGWMHPTRLRDSEVKMTLHGKKMTMRTIEEEMAEVGLDPKKSFGEIERMTGLIEDRSKMSPPIPGLTTPRAADHRALQESNTGAGGSSSGAGDTSKDKPKLTFMGSALAEAVAAGKDPK